MREVAQGNWDYRAEAGGDEEIAMLVSSFNQMTSELKAIHLELQDRHRYIQNILANITAGVVSLDPQGRLATVNPAAAAMLGMRLADVAGRSWQETFGRPGHEEIAQLIAEVSSGHLAKAERPIRLSGGLRPLNAWVTATVLLDDARRPHGLIVFFEDVTHLTRVERMEAWREVARRIAHEIKNPLTPIQLSAQRIRKRCTALAESDANVVEECTRTIIGQVEALKRLVNEFSQFARLPKIEVEPSDLNALVDETVILFREGHPGIRFEVRPEADLPSVDVDREAMKRVMINLLDNAVAACQTCPAVESRVELATSYDRTAGVVRVEVADNGCGMSPEVKARAFEPYFSSKRDGTGLGLAIVSAVVADHQAYVRLEDNQPRGTRVVIEFPVRHRPVLRAARA
jgi:two-component system nitrogen regulation sensor histidine kinase NtrY